MYFRKINNENYFDYYTIEKGDSIYKISRKFNINPNLLASINGLDMDDYIYPGQILLIPYQGYSYYVTKKGDTLLSVANAFNVSVDKLVNDNHTIYLDDGQMIVNKKN